MPRVIMIRGSTNNHQNNTNQNKTLHGNSKIAVYRKKEKPKAIKIQKFRYISEVMG